MQIELKFDRKQNARASRDFPKKKCMSEQHHVIVYLREDNYRQGQTIQHHMEVMETLQPTSFD